MVDGVPQFTDSYYHNDEMTPAVIDEVLLLVYNPMPYSVRRQIVSSSEMPANNQPLQGNASIVWSQNAEQNLRIPYTVFSDDDWGACPPS